MHNGGSEKLWVIDTLGIEPRSFHIYLEFIPTTDMSQFSIPNSFLIHHSN